MSDETSEASSFRLLFNSESPGRAVLEFDTDSHPIRVLTQEQLDLLSTEAKIASVKLSWRSQGSEST
jgi:hypothetical protein